MTEPPIDFSPLDPPEGAAHWRHLAQRIEDAAAPELARRAARRGGMVAPLLRGWRPILAAAAAIVALASAALVRRPAPADPAAAALAALAGVPYESALAMAGAGAPGLGQLLLQPEGR